MVPSLAKLRPDVIATPTVIVGFVGTELVLDPAYERARDACHKGIRELFGVSRRRQSSEGHGRANRSRSIQ
jgi:hypothetical protein